MGAQIDALRCAVPVQGGLIGRLLVNHSPSSACQRGQDSVSAQSVESCLLDQGGACGVAGPGRIPRGSPPASPRQCPGLAAARMLKVPDGIPDLVYDVGQFGCPDDSRAHGLNQRPDSREQ